VFVTVAPAVAFPTRYVFVTPTVGVGDSDPVSVTAAELTVRLTVDAAWVTEPFAPCRVIFP
jgi:hypothetical protein